MVRALEHIELCVPCWSLKILRVIAATTTGMIDPAMTKFPPCATCDEPPAHTVDLSAANKIQFVENQMHNMEQET